jgi:parallel beta-helix repeat protein
MSYRSSTGAFALATALMVTMSGARGADATATDGVVLIDQARALAGNVTPGDTPGFPVTISEPGSYRLASNLTVIPDRTAGILIAADNVTIDLGGFSIGSGGNGDFGIVTNDSHHTNLIIRNGTIARVSAGVSLEGNPSVSITRLRVHQSFDFAAITVGDNASITDSTIYDNHAEGMRVGMNSLITGNVIFNNGADGIDAGDGSIISGNTVSNNAGTGGIVCSSSCTINGNMVSSNHYAGISAGGASTINNNTTTGNNGDGIYCSSGCSIGANEVSRNSALGIEANCPSVIHGNLASDNGDNIVTRGTPCARGENIPSP